MRQRAPTSVDLQARRRRPAVIWNVGLIEADMLDRNWTQTDLADASGVRQPTISRLLRRGEGVERGGNRPKLIRAIAKALRKPVSRYLIVPSEDAQIAASSGVVA